MQCHLLAVGHMKRCDATVCQRMGNVTHLLLVIGHDVMRLPCTKYEMSLTCCWSYERYSGTISFPEKCNVTHLLLIIGTDVMNCHSQNLECHSLSVGHRKGHDETAFHKMHNATHSLLVIGNDVIKLPFTKFAM